MRGTIIAHEVRTRGWALFNQQGEPSAKFFNALVPELFKEYPLEAKSHILRPYSESEAPPASMSSLTGFAAQPLHTDGAHRPRPPRYILFRCLNPGEESCPTVVWTLDWHALKRDWPADLARNGWLIQPSADTRFYGSVLERESEGMHRIRFDMLCMAPPSGAGSVTTAVACINRYAEVHSVTYAQDDCLLLDNWRVLHGRGEGAVFAKSRRLQRWASRGVKNGLG